MVILLYGPNTYSRSKKLRELINDRVSKQQIPFYRFDLENEEEYSNFMDSLNSRSMFSIKKIIILDNAFEAKNKKELKKVIQDCISDRETLMIIISDTKPPASFSFLLDKNEDTFLTNQYFPDFKKGEDLRNFIKKESLQRGIKFETDEIETIESSYGSDAWAIVTELDKLELVQERQPIGKIGDVDYFKTVNSFKFGKTPKDRILNLETLLSVRGDEPAKVFNMLGFGYSTKELIDSLADYDVMIKSGKLDYEEALLDLALR